MKSNIFRKNLFVILILSLVMCGCSSITEESSINLDADNIIEDAEILTLSNETNVKTIYTTEFQDDIYDQIQELKSNDYTFASPLIIANPYCTNTTSLYVYFNTDKSVEISYTITADGYSDFSYTTSGGYGTEHEYQLIGLVGGL